MLGPYLHQFYFYAGHPIITVPKGFGVELNEGCVPPQEEPPL